jgi:hypothetical protein
VSDYLFHLFVSYLITPYSRIHMEYYNIEIICIQAIREASPLNPAFLYLDIEAIANQLLTHVRSVTTLHEDVDNISNYDMKVRDTLLTLKQRTRNHFDTNDDNVSYESIAYPDIESLVSAVLTALKFNLIVNGGRNERTPSVIDIDVIYEVRDTLLKLLDEGKSLVLFKETRGERRSVVNIFHSDLDDNDEHGSREGYSEVDTGAARLPRRRLGTKSSDLMVMRTIASKVSSKLPTWKSTGDPCSDNNWAGVFCTLSSSSPDNRIRKIDLPNSNLAGMIDKVSVFTSIIISYSLFSLI